MRSLICFAIKNKGVLSILFFSALNVGVVIRFWVSVLAPRDQYIADWSPFIYGITGFFLAAIVLQYTLVTYRHLDKLPRYSNLLLLAINILCFANYLGIAAYLFYSSLTADVS